MIWHDFPIAVHRTARRKTMSIIVERDGSLSVQVPSSMSDDQIIDILNKKEYDIFQKRAQWQSANKEHITRQYLSGQSFLYLGKSYLLSVIPKQKQNLVFRNGTFYLSSNAQNPKSDFIRFYKRQAKNKISERIDFFRSQIPIMPQKVQIKDMPTRWGSCTPKGNVYYNWRCIMVPLFVLDYLIIHELMHLECPDHSRRFWARISDILPEYRYAIDWLKNNGVRTEL